MHGFQKTATLAFNGTLSRTPNTSLCSVDLSPIGSVWIVHGNITFCGSGSGNLQTLMWGVQQSNTTNTWSVGSPYVCGHYAYITAQFMNNGNTSSMYNTGVHVVGASSNYLNLGHYMTYSDNKQFVGCNLICTRIA